jgi:hypothetical protein
MQPAKTTLGEVLLRIYEFPLEVAIFLPTSGPPFSAQTPCMVGWDEREDSTFRQACLEQGLVNWLNVAVVSDTCDEVVEKDIANLIAAFNEDCQDGGWLQEMMNYGRDKGRGQ